MILSQWALVAADATKGQSLLGLNIEQYDTNDMASVSLHRTAPIAPTKILQLQPDIGTIRKNSSPFDNRQY